MGRRACSFCSTREASSWSQAVCLTSMTPSSRSVLIVSSRASPAGAPAGAARARIRHPGLQGGMRPSAQASSRAARRSRAPVPLGKHPASPACAPRAQRRCWLHASRRRAGMDLPPYCGLANGEDVVMPVVRAAQAGGPRGYGRQTPVVSRGMAGGRARAPPPPPHAGPCGQRKWGARGRAAAGPRLWSCPWRRVARTQESADHAGARRSERDPPSPADPTAKRVPCMNAPA